MEKTHYKALNFEQSRLKFAPTNSELMTFEGYASVYGNTDSQGDIIKQSAYDSFINTGAMPVMFFNHDKYDIPIGRYTQAKSDTVGLYVHGELTKGLSKSQDLWAAMQHGTVNGLSVGIPFSGATFKTLSSGGLEFTDIQRVNEISICTFPANTQARMSAIKSIDGIHTIRDGEDYLREAGLSKSEAVAFIGRIKTAIRSDSEGNQTAAILQQIASFTQSIKGN
jgi:uncharacterized protein